MNTVCARQSMRLRVQPPRPHWVEQSRMLHQSSRCSTEGQAVVLPPRCPLTALHCAFTVLSLRFHCSLAALSSSSHCPLAVLSLSSHCPLTTLPLPSHCLSLTGRHQKCCLRGASKTRLPQRWTEAVEARSKCTVSVTTHQRVVQVYWPGGGIVPCLGRERGVGQQQRPAAAAGGLGAS